MDARRARLAVWAKLAELIGSHDGRAFRVFAQSLTLDRLLSAANHHLRDLAPRYRLQRVPGQDLAIQVVDLHMGEEVRTHTIQNMAGDEPMAAILRNGEVISKAIRSFTS